MNNYVDHQNDHNVHRNLIYLIYHLHMGFLDEYDSGLNTWIKNALKKKTKYFIIISLTFDVNRILVDKSDKLVLMMNP